MNSFIGTKEAAERLHISVRRIQAMISAGQLKAKKIGNSYAIQESDLRVLNGRKSGRPTQRQDERTREEWKRVLSKFIGSVSGPADLSTNPKYMKGYGKDSKRMKPNGK